MKKNYNSYGTNKIFAVMFANYSLIGLLTSELLKNACPSYSSSIYVQKPSLDPFLFMTNNDTACTVLHICNCSKR
jgi:hypothetical protein